LKCKNNKFIQMTELTYDGWSHVLSKVNESERLNLRLVSKLFNNVIISFFPRKHIADLIAQKKLIPAMYFLQNYKLYPEYYNFNDILRTTWHNPKFLDYMIKFGLINVINLFKKSKNIEAATMPKEWRLNYDNYLVILLQTDEVMIDNYLDYKYLIRNGLVKAFERLMRNPHFIILDDSLESLVVYAIDNIKCKLSRCKTIDVIIECDSEYKYGEICADSLIKLAKKDIILAERIINTYSDDIIYDILVRNSNSELKEYYYFLRKDIKNKYMQNEIIIRQRILQDYSHYSKCTIVIPNEFNNCPLSIDTSGDWDYKAEFRYKGCEYDYDRKINVYSEIHVIVTKFIPA
ncbi:F-box domain-containing protein, partial [Pacmanvirus A23]|uniref:F-box domain-containing protein n=1 Tax=Pacmanvirus A23 TaxID=1932881 RepID=UPI000A094186